ncbi:MAG: putative manganese-dependent inorganic diphosphatase [Lachnospiraceae bacterium]|nr:putative manganese-dependent inorganic diphosphatase [Lachnospiraceae bacterium]
MSKKQVWVVGHKHPDTDSVCAAIAYANYKNALDGEMTYIPKRAGSLNAETVYVLNRFGVEAPELVTDVGTQMRDIKIRRTEGVSSHISMKKAWEMMKILGVVTLPVVNDHKLEGLIVTGDIAKSYMDVYDNTILSTARTQYKNIIETLEGQLLAGNEHAYFVRGKVVIGAGTPEGLASSVASDDLVLIGDGEDAQLLSIASNCSCMVVTNGYEVSEKVMQAAKEREVVLISTPYDTFTASRLLNQSIPIKYFMTKEDIIYFEEDDYVDDVRDTVAKIRHRDFPILDENQNYVGMFSRRNLMNAQKKKLILVDHNEKSQAVTNIEEAEILEIIDHHRLGSLETMAPVYFRNQPLGCTSTIIYQMYKEKQIKIEKTVAGLMCAAILSDTLMFRSPTCTEADKDAALELAKLAEVDAEELALAMFEAGSDFSEKTEEEILNQDFKIFHAGDIDFGVAQISAMGRQELDKVQKRIEPKLERMLGEKQIQMIFVMLTDILNESTYLSYAGADAAQLVASAYHCEPSEAGVMLPGVVSRKKQLIPALINVLAER